MITAIDLLKVYKREYEIRIYHIRKSKIPSVIKTKKEYTEFVADLERSIKILEQVKSK